MWETSFLSKIVCRVFAPRGKTPTLFTSRVDYFSYPVSGIFIWWLFLPLLITSHWLWYTPSVFAEDLPVLFSSSSFSLYVSLSLSWWCLPRIIIIIICTSLSIFLTNATSIIRCKLFLYPYFLDSYTRFLILASNMHYYHWLLIKSDSLCTKSTWCPNLNFFKICIIV